MGLTEDNKKEIRELVRLENEEQEKRLAKKIIPENYTRCKNCGSVIKESEACPYCKKEVKEESLDDIFNEDKKE